jgi:hypothetical protein
LQLIDVLAAEQPPEDLEFASGELRKSLGPQDGMGWEATFTGCWAQGFRFEHSGFVGKCWLAAIIEKLWDVAWNTWEHQNHVLHKEQEALLCQQEDAAILAEFAMGFAQFPKNLCAHTRRSVTSALRSKPEDRSSCCWSSKQAM